jgi:hypothetical protein
LRPAYESTLDWLSGGSGIEWEINGVFYRIESALPPSNKP